MKTVIAFIGTVLSVALLVALSAWEHSTSQTLPTTWYGKGCLQVSTVSVPTFLNDTVLVNTTISNVLLKKNIDMQTVLYVKDTDVNGTDVNDTDVNGTDVKDTDVKIDIGGTMSAKTVTGARRLYSGAMKDVGKILQSNFKSRGVYGVTTCGLTIDLPTNVNTTAV